MKSLHAIAAKLKASMGLDMATVGTSLIERVVRERMAVLAIDSDQLYLAQLHIDAHELQQLIELAVVPETWFFRDPEAMQAVARLGRQQVLEGASRLRILSLPCSTGEEPYSLAMALFDAGVPANAFQIDAIDIRTRSLEIAADGVYGRNSFRGRALDFCDRYFQSEGEGQWRISAEVQAQVRFAAGNILAPEFMQQALPYDFILCRNVLIYFEREVQEQVVTLLERLMADDGHIFVGPAEGGLMLSERVASAGIPLAFGFRKRRPGELRPVSARPIVPLAALTPMTPMAPMPPMTPMTPTPRLATAVTSVRATAVTPPLGAKTAAPTPDLLAQARRLADQGDFVQALALCERAVRELGPSADVFYLQGLIGDASGDIAAAQRCYRKAVYLDPAHHEALQHLAALLQAQGDSSGAQLMRQRAERAEKAEKATKTDTAHNQGRHG